MMNGCHGFVILLLVFHIIMSCKAQVIKDLILQFHGLTTFRIPASQKRRTTYPRGLWVQRPTSHKTRSFTHSLPGSVWVYSPANSPSVQSKVFQFQTLSFYLIYCPQFQLYCVILHSNILVNSFCSSDHCRCFLLGPFPYPFPFPPFPVHGFVGPPAP